MFLFSSLLVLFSNDCELDVFQKVGPSKIECGDLVFSFAVNSIDAKSAGLENAWGGDVYEPVNSIIAIPKVEYKHRPIYIPVSVFTALGSLNKVSVHRQGKKVEIRINGGDGGNGYDAVISARQIGDDLKIVSREVRNGIFPEKKWERTTYSYF